MIAIQRVDELLQDTAIAETISEESFTPVDGYAKKSYTDAQIIRISNKSIGSLQDQITVEGESLSQYIVFEHERYADGIDLKEKLLQIHYERADGVGDNSPAVNVEASDEHIRFGWIVPQKATQVEGILRVMPFIFGKTPDSETYILKDLFAQYTVHEGLELAGGIDEPFQDEWYIQFLDNINTINTSAEEVKEYVEQAKKSETNAKNSADSANSSATSASQSAASAKTSQTASAESEKKSADYLKQVEEIRDSIDEEAVLAAQREIRDVYIPEIQGYTSQAGESRDAAANSEANAQESESAAQHYYELTQTLSITNVGDITFSLDAERGCLTATYMDDDPETPSHDWYVRFLNFLQEYADNIKAYAQETEISKESAQASKTSASNSESACRTAATQADSYRSEAATAADLAEQYAEQTRQLSIANVGELTFAIDEIRECLTVSYGE